MRLLKFKQFMHRNLDALLVLLILIIIFGLLVMAFISATHKPKIYDFKSQPVVFKARP